MDETADRLAGDLADTDFDAVERDGLRAAWTDDGTSVVVRVLGGTDATGATDATSDDGPAATGPTAVTYDGEDLIRATSDQELANARTGAETRDS